MHTHTRIGLPISSFYLSMQSIAFFQQQGRKFAPNLLRVSQFNILIRNRSSAPAYTNSKNVPKPFYSENGWYYAVRNGRKMGIFETHQEFEAYVKSFSDAEGKKFRTFHEALRYLTDTEPARKATRELPLNKNPLSADYCEGLYYLNAAIHPAPLPSKCLRVYTDGSHNPCGAGIGVWIEDGHPCNHSAPFKPTPENDRPSNNKAEIQVRYPFNCRILIPAVSRALERLPIDIDLEIRTDSMYVIQGITAYFQQKNFPASLSSSFLKRLSDKLYFEELARHIEKRSGKVYFVHVRAHQGIRGNEEADKLAKEGANRFG